MMFSSATAESGALLAQLGMAAIRTITVAGLAALLLALLRVKAASARLFTWTAVLYAGLSIPILAWLLPPVPIRVPFPLSPATASLRTAHMSTAPRALNQNQFAARNVSIARVEETSLSARRTQVARRWLSISSRASVAWTSLAALLYLAVALFFLLKLLLGLACTRRLVRSSEAIEDARVMVRLSSYAKASGQRVVPQALESPLVSVPVTIGVVAPTILLPADWTEWDNAKLDAVIAHEMSHVARRDGLSQCLSVLHRAIFWFSPLAWWLDRRLAALAEEVSDEAALSAGAERNRYAATLLEFFAVVQAGEHRIQWQGVSIAHAAQAEKRLRKILAWRGEKPMRWNRSTLALIVLLASSVLYLAAAARPVHEYGFSPAQSAQEPVPPAPPAAEPTPPAATPASPPSPPNGGILNHGPAPAEPNGPATPPPPASPRSPVSSESYPDQDSGTNDRYGFRYAYGFDDAVRFVIVSGNTNAFSMSGTSEDARHVEELRKRIPGDFIWFERDEKSYIIRDQATVDRARRLWAPQEELGRRQEELGRQQEELGKQQEELGKRMEGIHVKVPDMSRELDQLKSEYEHLGTTATVEQVGKMQAEMAELQSKIAETQANAGNRQAELGGEMAALGEKQAELGRQQGQLGRQQGELAQKATQAMKELLDDAIKRGIAQPESDETHGASI